MFFRLTFYPCIFIFKKGNFTINAGELSVIVETGVHDRAVEVLGLGLTGTSGESTSISVSTASLAAFWRRRHRLVRSRPTLRRFSQFCFTQGTCRCIILSDSFSFFL